jgi:colicin import membrane protein
MNDMTQPDASTALALPTAVDLAAMFKAENGLDDLLSRLERQAREEAEGVDVSTKKGRDALKSIAFRVSKSKVSLEDRAKELTEQQRKEIAAVNAGRNAAIERLESLRDEIKKPAIDWEAAEDERIASLRERLAMIDAGGLDATSPSGAIADRILEVTAMQTGDCHRQNRTDP